MKDKREINVELQVEELEERIAPANWVIRETITRRGTIRTIQETKAPAAACPLAHELSASERIGVSLSLCEQAAAGLAP